MNTNCQSEEGREDPALHLTCWCRALWEKGSFERGETFAAFFMRESAFQRSLLRGLPAHLPVSLIPGGRRACKGILTKIRRYGGGDSAKYSCEGIDRSTLVEGPGHGKR